jgi:predicted lipoprotein
MKRSHALIVLAVLAVACCWRWPLVHVLKLSEVRAAKEAAEFRPDQAAQKFWQQQLPDKLVTATDAAEFLAALDKDPAAAKESLGRQVGLGRITYLFALRGKGTVTHSAAKGVAIRLGDGNNADFYFPSAPIFGNAIRDATGVFLASQFTNSQQFNDISGELNRLVEQKLIPKLAGIKDGQSVEFVGCLELPPGQTITRPFKLIPLDLKVD